jgi:tripartite-type tricarboxylate transporter receptor subunit TctC
MMTSNPVTLAPYMHLRAPFDPVDDLGAVTRVVTMPLAVVTSARSSVNTLPELMAYIKAHPGKTNFASIGMGSQSHLQGYVELSGGGHWPFQDRLGLAALDDFFNRYSAKVTGP